MSWSSLIRRYRNRSSLPLSKTASRSLSDQDDPREPLVCPVVHSARLCRTRRSVGVVPACDLDATEHPENARWPQSLLLPVSRTQMDGCADRSLQAGALQPRRTLEAGVPRAPGGGHAADVGIGP